MMTYFCNLSSDVRSLYVDLSDMYALSLDHYFDMLEKKSSHLVA